MEFDFVISRSEIIPPDVTNELVTTLRKEGLRVEEEEREQEIFAALEWLVPTAIIVFIAKEYVGTLLKEAAKDHYPRIKKSLSKLVSRTSGEKSEVKLSYVASSPKKVVGKTPSVLSVIAQLHGDRIVKFVFEHDLPEVKHERAVDRMFDLLVHHFSEYPDDRITNQAPRKTTRWKDQVIMRFDNEVKDDWVIVDLRRQPDSE